MPKVLSVQFVVRGTVSMAVLALAVASCFAQGATSANKFQLLKAGKLPRPMLMHGTAIVGNRMYVMGGNFEEQLPSGKVIDHWPKAVYSAEIKADATLGAWRPETPLPETRAYIENSVQVINDRIYILGGNVHPTETSIESDYRHSNDVLWTRVNRDGTLAPWQKSEPFRDERSCAATCATDRFLYVVGGTADSGLSGITDISCADIAGSATGRSFMDTKFGADAGQVDTPRNWRKAGDLPVALYYQGAAILEGTMYVWGGYFPKTATADSGNHVYSTVIKPDGTVGPWREESSMLAGTNSAGFCGFNDYLVSVAGRVTGGIPTSGIQFAHLQDKKVEPWQGIDSDIQTRVFHSLGLDRSKGVLYITGGRFRSGVNREKGNIQDIVQAFQLPQRQPVQLGGSSAPTGSGGNLMTRFNTSLKDALLRAAQENRKILVFFYSPAVPAVQRLCDNVLNKPEFDQLAAAYLRSAVDVSGVDQPVASRFGVYRVPCLVELNPAGQMLKRSATLSTADDVQGFLLAQGL